MIACPLSSQAKQPQAAQRRSLRYLTASHVDIWPVWTLNQRWRSCCLLLFLPPLKKAMITPFCIFKLRPAQKCSGKTAAALWAGQYYKTSWFRFSCQCFWSLHRGITVNDPGLKILAVFLLQCFSDSWFKVLVLPEANGGKRIFCITNWTREGSCGIKPHSFVQRQY